MSENTERIRTRIASSNILRLEYDLTSECVRHSNASRSEYKALTLDIMNEVKSSNDMYTMEAVAKVVGKWSKEQLSYYEEVIDFCRVNEDISEFLIGSNDNINDIVLIVDDSTKENVLDYNDFLFKIRRDKSEINDFLVVDSFMLNAVCAMYKNLKSIYKRG